MMKAGAVRRWDEAVWGVIYWRSAQVKMCANLKASSKRMTQRISYEEYADSFRALLAERAHQAGDDANRLIQHT